MKEKLFIVDKRLAMIQINMVWKFISLLLVFNKVRQVEGQGGIVFEPFVRNADDPDYSNAYKKNDVKVMLELISQDKFHYVSTLSVGAPNEPYKPNSTLQRCSSNVHAAVAAAEINKSKQRHLLSIYQGVFLSYMKQLETEISVAFEVTSLANQIYGKTVPALVLTQSSFWQISDRPEIVKKIYERAQTSDLQLGARISDCETSIPGLDSHHQQTLRLFHFIICERTPINVTTILSGPQLFKEVVTADIMKVENAIQGMGIETKVILETGWPGDIHLGQLASVSDMFHFWKLIQEWSRSGKRMVFMNEAFDNPWRDLKTVEKIENSVAIPRTLSVWGGHYGIWKHLEVRDNSRNAYVPKVENSGSNGGGRDGIGRGLGGGITVGAVACADAGNGVSACADAGAGDSAVATATAYSNSGSESRGNSGVIIGSVLGSVVLMLIILILLLSRRVKKLKKRSLSKVEIQQFLDGGLSSQENVEAGETSWARGAYNRELELEKHSFSIDKSVPLGSGAFGSVYKGRICNSGSEYEVAFKTTRPSCPAFALRGLLSEIKILSHLGKHENIVGICGAYTAELDKGVAYVATELCSNGSLEKFLRVNRANDFNYVTSNNQATAPVLNELQLYRWTLEIAEGMEYISTKNVIHADLAARNVLLTDGLTAKITDFGLSRRLYEYTEYVKQKQEPLPWRWMAVESLKRLEFSTKSDVWAYGITLWEIWSLGDIPYPGRSWDPDFVLELENGLRNTKPSSSPCSIYDTMVSCWNLNPARRPAFEDIKLELKSATEVMNASNSRNSVEYLQLVEMDINNSD